jgi:hypothetical protein
MKFTPKSDKEIRELNLFKEGIYEFEIISVTDTVTTNTRKPGIPKLEIVFRVWNDEGIKKLISDHITEEMHYKLKNLCKSIRLLDKYDSGEINDLDLIGKFGLLKLIIRKGDPIPNNPNNECYPDKNYIKDYIIYESNKNDPASLNDEIPF